MRTYTQLTQVQRYQISALKKMEDTPSEIAEVLKVNRSTVSRELQRNTGERGYRPKQADEKARSRRPKAKVRIETDEWKVVEEKLRQDWSPEQVSGWLKRQAGPSISHEWIYQYILADQHSGGDLYKHLRCQKKRRKRYGSPERRGKLSNRVSIEERPEVVNQCARLGDWEADTVIGKKPTGRFGEFSGTKIALHSAWIGTAASGRFGEANHRLLVASTRRSRSFDHQ